MKKKALNSWVIAGIIGLLYDVPYYILLNLTNPKGNRWTVTEFACLVGATLISTGCIFLCHAIANRFFYKVSLGYRYAITLLMSIPLFCAIFLPYWVYFIRYYIYGLPTDRSIYAGQLMALTTGLHLPIAIIAITSLYNAHAHKAQTQLLNVQRVLVETQFKNLQQQVNPHFLFNSLNILSALIKLDTNKSILFTQKLAEVYRFFLKTQKEVLISLREELQFVNNYFFLVTCRFGKAFRLDVQHDSGTSCNDLYVIPGTLQLLVENAVKHNTANEEFPVIIKIKTDDNTLTVLNLISKKENTESGYGLSNLALRYQLLNKEKVNYFEREGIFCVQIPLLKNIVSL